MFRKALIFLLASYAYATAANANNYQDWWVYAEGNLAFSVAQQNSSVYVMGYAKTGDNTAFLINFGGELINNNQVSGALSIFNTGAKDAADNQATITFSSIDTATLAYRYNGNQGTIPLKRLAFSPLSANGTWDGSSNAVVECPGQKAFIDSRPQTLTITANAPSGTLLKGHDLSMHVVSGQGVCDDSGTITQDGSHLNASGTGSCGVYIDGSTSHDTYTWEARDITAQDYWFVAKYTQTMTSGEHSGCVIKGLLSGVRHANDITHEFDN